MGHEFGLADVMGAMFSSDTGRKGEARFMRAFLLLPAAFLVSGCLARTAVDLVTLPVKVVGAGVDAVTTSQAEADQKRGREMREEEERLGREARKRDRQARKARRDGDFPD